MTLVSKSSVAYENPAKKPAHHCGNCTHYSAGTCDRVKGSIDPKAWCRLWRAK